MGTGNLYFLDNGGRQGRIYFGISNASENRVWQVQWGKWESDPNAPGPDTNTETPDGIRQSPDNVDETTMCILPLD